MIKKLLLPMSLFGALCGAVFASQSSFAGDIEWSGEYRIEGVSIYNPMLDTSVPGGVSKSYAVHNLILRPKIVAADGLYLNAQLNVFNNQGYNQLGAYLGDGPGSTNGNPSTSINDSSAQTSNERSVQLLVSQYYLTWMQENGMLIAGRIPMNFGLGMSYNSGQGLFDHFADTRDAVAYKIQMGNFSLTPMWTKVAQDQLSGGTDVTEYDIQLQYDNLDKGTSIGVMFANRIASPAANDTPAGPICGYDPNGCTGHDSMNTKNFNVFYKKEADDYKVGFELGMQGGNTGVDSSDGTNVNLSGFAVALEYESMPHGSKWGWGAKAGLATGENVNNHDQYSGFIFSRNYDVGMIMFNHEIGQADVLHTALIGRQDASPNQNITTSTVQTTPDTEAISNAYYLAPSLKYRWNDHWSLVGTLVTGFLDNNTVYINTTPASASFYKTGNSLGYELDLSLAYHFTDKILWVNEFGYLLPGDAWAVDGQFATDNVFGLTTRAAVSF
jgi:hypothetical protein